MEEIADDGKVAAVSVFMRVFYWFVQRKSSCLCEEYSFCGSFQMPQRR